VALNVTPQVASNGIPAAAPQAAMAELLKSRWLCALLLVALVLLGTGVWYVSDSSRTAAAAATYHNAVAAVEQLWHVIVDTTWAWLVTRVTLTNMSLLPAAALVCALVAAAVKHQVFAHSVLTKQHSAALCCLL
jgi:hypothetical protein